MEQETPTVSPAGPEMPSTEEYTETVPPLSPEEEVAYDGDEADEEVEQDEDSEMPIEGDDSDPAI